MRHDCSVSLDLSHIGLAIDPALALRHARRIAEATAAAGQEMLISMEGSDRTDAVLDVHGALCEQFDHVGVTILARLHRTVDDLPVLLSRPGRIRLVKGAYLEPETIALPRGSRELRDAYLRCAGALLDSDHLCSFATHDRDLLGELDRMLTGRPRTGEVPWEFETLLGLGPDRRQSHGIFQFFIRALCVVRTCPRRGRPAPSDGRPLFASRLTAARGS